MKQSLVKSGKYAGMTAVILGTDREVLGKSILGVRAPISVDYIGRFAKDGYSALDNVLIAIVNGEQVALNEKDFTKQKGKKNG